MKLKRGGMKEVYRIMSLFPKQKLCLGDIIREMKLAGSKLDEDTIRRHCADMTFQENKNLRSQFPGLIRHGEGVYEFNPKLVPKSPLEMFYDAPPKKVKIKFSIETSR